jgi:hypothetical protein
MNLARRRFLRASRFLFLIYIIGIIFIVYFSFIEKSFGHPRSCSLQSLNKHEMKKLKNNTLENFLLERKYERFNSYNDFISKKGYSVRKCFPEENNLARSCRMSNICLSREMGLFQFTDNPLQEKDEYLYSMRANLDNSDEPFWYGPPFHYIGSYDSGPKEIIYFPNGEVSVIRPYSWEHLTHFLMNNMLALYHTFYAGGNIRENSVVWVVDGQSPTHFPLNLISDMNFIVSSLKIENSYTVGPIHPDDLFHKIDSKVICWRNGVLGQNNHCNQCQNRISSETLKGFVKHVKDRIMPSESFGESNKRCKKVGILLRENTRKFINHQSLVEPLLKYTQDIHFVKNLEGFSLYEQVQIFHQFDVVIGVHGNGIMNSLWMFPTTEKKHLIEFFPYGFWSPTFETRWDLLQDANDKDFFSIDGVVENIEEKVCRFISLKGFIHSSDKDFYVMDCSPFIKVYKGYSRVVDDKILFMDANFTHIVDHTYRIEGKARLSKNYKSILCKDAECIDATNSGVENKSKNIVLKGRVLTLYQKKIDSIFSE